MFDKKYYFLSGFPRSGNTLLSSILNQNPDISVYANSIVSELLYDIDRKKDTSELFKNFPDEDALNNISKNLFKNYYSHLQSKYVIDRSSWSSEIGINLLKKYCPNEIKIIFLHRDIIEILASFIKWSEENNTFLDNFGTTEERCNFLMSRNGPIMRHYIGIQNLIKDSQIKCKFIGYKDIISNCRFILDDIYDFLGIEKYNHRFKNIDQYSLNGIEYNDAVLGSNLHTIRSEIKQEKYRVEDYLSESIIQSYEHLKIDFL